MYYFSEGTMMTYNPSLSKYNITVVDYENDDDTPNEYKFETSNTKKSKTEDTSDMVDIDIDIDTDIENPLEVKFNKQFIYSTRKVLGTSSFNSSKTFLDMFQDNNKVNKIDLNQIPNELIKDTVLVFNIEHPDNNIISTIKRNTNILCAVFQFKKEEQSQLEYSKIMDFTYSKDVESDIEQLFNTLGNNMVTQIKVETFKQKLYNNNIKVNFQLPKMINYFEKTKETLEPKETLESNETLETKEKIDVTTFSIEQLEYIVDNKSKFFHGYILYGINGERTKITNQKYKDLCELKGNNPINITHSNTKNIFYLYIRLVKQKNIFKFIKEFDTNLNPEDPTYKQVFMWFYTLINKYSLSLFKIYHYAFVKKTFNKTEIPYALKPLCGELHKLYKSNNIPITRHMIEVFLLEQPASKLYWRLFDNELEIIPIEDIISQMSLSPTITNVDTNSEINSEPSPDMDTN